MSRSFYTVYWDDLDAVVGVPKGGMLVMKSVMLTGRCTEGRAVGGTMGQAMAWAVGHDCLLGD